MSDAKDTALHNIAITLCEIDGLDPWEEADGGFTQRFAGRAFPNWQTKINEARKLKYAQTVRIVP
jgi:hypothetical protein